MLYNRSLLVIHFKYKSNNKSLSHCGGCCDVLAFFRNEKLHFLVCETINSRKPPVDSPLLGLSWWLLLHPKWSRPVVSDSLRPHGLVAYQAPPSMGFFRQEYWSGLPFPSPGDLPNPGIEPRSPALQADALPSESPGEYILYMIYIIRARLWKIYGSTKNRYCPRNTPFTLPRINYNIFTIKILPHH